MFGLISLADPAKPVKPSALVAGSVRQFRSRSNRRYALRLLRLLIPVIPLTPLMLLMLLMLLAPPLVMARADAAVTAVVTSNQLEVSGDGAANQITLRLFFFDDQEIQVLDGPLIVGSFSRATFDTIEINAGGGNDTIVLSRIFGSITVPATINGGPGQDILSGGVGADALNGGPGIDRIVWNAGAGDDVIFHRQVDGNQTIEGGPGNDLLESIGPNVSQVVDIVRNGGDVRLTCDVDSISLAIGDVERISLVGSNGNDTLRGSNGLAAIGVVSLILNGVLGDDVIIGGDTNDDLTGGPGIDSVSGGAGDDILRASLDFDVMEAVPAMTGSCGSAAATASTSMAARESTGSRSPARTPAPMPTACLAATRSSPSFAILARPQWPGRPKFSTSRRVAGTTPSRRTAAGWQGSSPSRSMRGRARIRSSRPLPR
jgi:hypothetical protein